LKRWLRYAENLRAIEEDMICYCWPETGQSLDGDDDDDDGINWNQLMVSNTAGWAERKKFHFEGQDHGSKGTEMR
jgi:hypothetical protein